MDDFVAPHLIPTQGRSNVRYRPASVIAASLADSGPNFTLDLDAAAGADMGDLHVSKGMPHSQAAAALLAAHPGSFGHCRLPSRPLPSGRKPMLVVGRPPACDCAITGTISQTDSRDDRIGRSGSVSA
jgi:hypothetical protein